VATLEITIHSFRPQHIPEPGSQDEQSNPSEPATDDVETPTERVDRVIREHDIPETDKQKRDAMGAAARVRLMICKAIREGDTNVQ
jgi:hypothetical protein